MGDDTERLLQQYQALVERIRRLPVPEGDKQAFLAEVASIYGAEAAAERNRPPALDDTGDEELGKRERASDAETPVLIMVGRVGLEPTTY